MRSVLEVRVTQAGDAHPAEAGGADRLDVVGALTDGGLSPEALTKIEEAARLL